MNITWKVRLVAAVDVRAARRGHEQFIHRTADKRAADDVTERVQNSGDFKADEVDARKIEDRDKGETGRLEILEDAQTEKEGNGKPENGRHREGDAQELADSNVANGIEVFEKPEFEVFV